MKSPSSSSVRDRTRRAILEAMADVITDTGGIGFSVQAVADHAGLTHRTIYNHFPTRDALCDAFSDYVDEVLESTSDQVPPALHSVNSMPSAVETLYRALGSRDRHARAAVMLMIGSRRPATAWRQRTRSVEKVIAAEMSDRLPLTPRQVTAAVRMFVSTMGWHFMTEHSGLSTEEAAAVSEWATRTLLDAATKGAAPARSARHTHGDVHVPRRRRR